MRESRRGSRRDEGELWKGLAAGLVGGLIASWTMNQFQAMWSRLSEGVEKSHGAQSLQPAGGQEGVQQMKRAPEENSRQQEDATEKIASAISEGIFDHRLKKSEKEVAGAAVHYAYGTTTGALYGAMAELVPGITAGAGLPFGATVWLVADEGIVPALGLSKGPTEYSLSTHAYALASHFIYGLTTEAVRRTVRSAL